MVGSLPRINASALRYRKADPGYNIAPIRTGNPSNQLAVISSYCQDTFSAIYHYFRALVVQQPFTTAEYNLAKTLRKALHDWEAARRQEGGEDGRQSFGRMVVGNELGSLKREEVVMQAMVYTMEE